MTVRAYFRNQMIQLQERDQLNDIEVDDLRDCINQIVLHITDGNEIEKEVVSVMGGEVFELHSQRIVREATEQYQKEIESLKQQLSQQLEEKDKRLEEKDRKTTKIRRGS